jgi:purine-binding chemotaxis protein CheW
VTTASQEATQQIVVFRMGRSEYALPIGVVKEIIRYAEPQATASDIPWMRGVINLRGGVIPVCDLAARLGTTIPDEERSRSKILIVEFDDAYTGVIVSDVEEVRTILSEQLDDVPNNNAASFISSVAKLDGRLVMLLDVENLLGDD